MDSLDKNLIKFDFMEEVHNIIEVRMAELRVASAGWILTTRGLGSCLGIVIYDPYKRIGGLAHPMLPFYEKALVKGNPAKFVDSGIFTMVEQLKKRGCNIDKLVAKLFGGAHMFASIPVGDILDIGNNNIKTAREVLASLKIRIIGEDVGGAYGRSIFFNLETGKVRVKTLFYGEKEV